MCACRSVILIGEEGKGFTYQMMQFQEERLWAAAANLKSMERVIEQTIEYTRNRKAFGKSILDNQVVHFRLAELATEIELLRALVYRACELYLAGTDVTRLASMAKLKAGRLQREVADACLQYWGGMGYMNESPISRVYRDGRLGSIGGGADEVMLTIICKLMGTLPGTSNVARVQGCECVTLRRLRGGPSKVRAGEPLQQNPDRQSRRDRVPDHAHGEGAGLSHGRRLQRCRCRCAACAPGR